MFNRRPSQLKVLTAHIAQLEAKIMDLSAQLAALAPSRTTTTPKPERQERPAWNGSTNLFPIAPSRLRPLKLVSQPLEHLDLDERQIDHVIVTPSHKVVAYDQAGIPWADYCGEFRRVGWKVLQNYKGRWQEVSYEVEIPVMSQALAL